MKFKDYCQPAIVSLVLAGINVIIYLFSIIDKTRGLNTEYNDYALLFLLCKIIFAFIWAYMLNALCKWKPHGKNIAWVLVLIPFIIIMIAIIGISSGLTYFLMLDKNQKELNEKVEQQEITVNEIKEGYKNNKSDNSHNMQNMQM